MGACGASVECGRWGAVGVERGAGARSVGWGVVQRRWVGGWVRSILEWWRWGKAKRGRRRPFWRALERAVPIFGELSTHAVENSWRSAARFGGDREGGSGGRR